MQKRTTFLPMSRPDIGDEEIQLVAEVLRSGWITSGPKTVAFEDALAKLAGAPHAVAVTSGTAGLHILFRALGIGQGDEVITPSLTFASTVNQVVLCGAKPVFVDCDYGTLNLRVEEIESKITPRTKAIVPVHFAGAPYDVDRVDEIARARKIAVIEDAAHAIGTSYKGKPVGSSGNPALWSFHPIKNITTGEGGMVTVHDPALDKKLRLLRFHGIERDAWKRYGKGGSPEYDIREPAFKYNLTDIQSAIGLAQLKKLDRMNARRKELAHVYLEALRGIPGLELPATPPYPHEHAWHIFVIKVGTMKRPELMAALADWNVGYGLHFPPCHLMSFVRERFGTRPGMLPNTELAGERIITLPLFPGMTPDDALYVAGALKEILRR